MSPIGRVFLVLNLGLAGAFVAFSGTYLQRADHWKQKHDASVTKYEKDTEELRSQKTAFLNKYNEELRKNGILATANTGLQNQNERAVADNATLQGRLTSMEGTLKAATSHLGKIDTELAASRQDSKASMDKAIAAEKVKDEAETKMNDALKQLADANFNIKNLNTKVGDQGAIIATRDQTIREKGVLLDLVNRRYPSIFETLHPLVTGTVSRVGASGNLVTIALQSGAENLKSGARFAIYNATEGYKGEATVSEVDSSKKFCFARLTLKNGKVVAGDNASTNLSAARTN